MSNTKHAAEYKETFEDSFTAADMADAAAQGFRDGVASVGAVGAEAAALKQAIEEMEGGAFGGGVSHECLQAMKAALAQQQGEK